MDKIKFLAGILFGLILPAYLLFSSFNSLSELPKLERKYSVVAEFSAIEPALNSHNDYVLFSLLSLENSISKVSQNKQVMKSVIIHIGFALISIGMMFVVMGFNQGGMEGSGSASGEISFNFQIAGSGLTTIVIGAFVVSLGAVPNRHESNPVPAFQPSSEIFISATQLRNEIAISIKDCLVAGEAKDICLRDLLGQLK